MYSSLLYFYIMLTNYVKLQICINNHLSVLTTIHVTHVPVSHSRLFVFSEVVAHTVRNSAFELQSFSKTDERNTVDRVIYKIVVIRT